MDLVNFANLSILQIANILLFGIIFGFLELTTNFYYIISDNVDLPRKQHSLELPMDATDDQVKFKVKRMLILGLGLLICSIFALLFDYSIFIVASALIMINGLIDYRRFRKIDTLLIWTVISILIGILLVI